MKKITIFFALLSASAGMLTAQNIDPTVEVTRGYKVELADAHKPSMEMAVPDTVYKFDLDFDYSVTDNPYRGSYEFNPYTMDLKPQSSRETPTVLYVNAGAGYTLNPVFDIVYSPVIDGKFSVDLYGHHKSYVGSYRAPHIGNIKAGKGYKDGYDLKSSASADFGYDWAKAVLDFGVSYYGIAVKDDLHRDDYNALDARFSLKSKSLWSKDFMYEISADYRFGENSEVRENIVNLNAEFGPTLKSVHKIFFGVGGTFASCGKLMPVTFGRVYVLPHYMYVHKRFKADIGARISYAGTDNGRFNAVNQYVYPDVRIDCLVKDVMRFYLNITGGEELNTYSSLLERNHHFYGAYQLDGGSLMGASLVRVKPEFGFEGKITDFFSYNLKGGYSLNAASPVSALIVRDGVYSPGIGYADSQICYAQFNCGLSLKSFRLDGNVRYTHLIDMQQAPQSVFYVHPSEWMADVSAVYNWNQRLYVGVDCNAASAGVTVNKAVYVPYYVDLGAFAEFAINKKISVWLRGGNLLDMEIQRNLLYAEKGINFTAGFCLNLQ